ncbi:hypothetical protein D3C71_917410 [compost metagenome]
MHAHARLQRQLQLGAQRVQFVDVVQGETQPVHGCIEQQEHAVGTVDQPAVPALQQLQHLRVEPAEQIGGGGIANALDQHHRVAQIREDQRLELTI